MIQVSVIVPSYNQPNTISRCIESILAQDFTEKYELIVVDSSIEKYQDAIEEICRKDKRIRLIKLKEQTYPGTARNIGIKEALGHIIALIDSDCIADRFWLKNIFTNIDENTILTGIIQNGTKNSIVGTCSFLVEFNHFLESNQYKKEIHVAATCNFACKKEVFNKVGYFTNDRAFEDFLFCSKFTAMGGSIYQIQDIRISHVNKTNLRDIAKNQKMLGFFSANVRKKNKMPPKLIFNYPILSFSLIGFRYISILTRIFRNKHLFSFILYNPIIIYLLIQWNLGFYNGAKEKNNNQ